MLMMMTVRPLIWIVCGNKSDWGEHRSVDEEEARQFANELDSLAIYSETSARDDQGVQEVFQELAEQAAATLSPTEIREDTVILRAESTQRLRAASTLL